MISGEAGKDARGSFVRCIEKLELVEDFGRDLVELSGIEPLASSLRIQGVKPNGETPDDTK
jgi:hypothetical protein